MKIESFSDIESWKQARALVADIYRLTNSSSMNRDYGFKDQIQRAAVSIMSNIAEGFDSGSDKSFLLFLSYSYRSASEVESLLYVALDIGYIDQTIFDELSKQTCSIKKLIGGFIRFLKSKTN